MHRFASNRFRSGGGFVILAFVFAAVVPAAQAVDILGGDPVYSQENLYDSQSWSAHLTSFVYDSTSTSFPNAVPVVPDSGETLFVYLIQNIGDMGDPAITSLTVANDFPAIDILDIGDMRDTSVDPADLMVTGNMQIPNSSEINPLSMVYTWQNGIIFDPPNPPVQTFVLQPNHYSLQYYLADTAYWELQNGTIQSAAQPETQLVPGPAPEPSTLALLGLAGLMLAGRGVRRVNGRLLAVLLAVGLSVVFVGAAEATAPSIGGSPAATETTVFGGTFDFEVTVHSYHYTGSDATLPPGFSFGGEVESLFFYLIENTTAGAGLANYVAIYNTESIPVPGTFLVPILPDGYDEGLRNNPQNFGGGNDLVGEFRWNQGSELLPGEWALVASRTLADYATLTDTFAGDFYDFELEYGQVLGPSLIPEPATLGLLAFGLVMLRRRR